ncbi:hypothetical protein CR513_01827, partial [Mucuna pruriens]
MRYRPTPNKLRSLEEKHQRQVKFLIVVVEYFTKWVEAKPVATIPTEQIKRTPADKWPSRVNKQGSPQRLKEKIGGRQMKVGREVTASTLVISHYATLHNPRNPIQDDIWHQCCDPSRNRRTIPQNHFLPISSQ